MKNMEEGLSRFRDFKLKFKPSKCELLKNTGTVREVKEWPTLKNKTELESFLGLINFYKEHWISA